MWCLRSVPTYLTALMGSSAWHSTKKWNSTRSGTCSCPRWTRTTTGVSRVSTYQPGRPVLRICKISELPSSPHLELGNLLRWAPHSIATWITWRSSTTRWWRIESSSTRASTVHSSSLMYVVTRRASIIIRTRKRRKRIITCKRSRKQIHIIERCLLIVVTVPPNNQINPNFCMVSKTTTSLSYRSRSPPQSSEINPATLLFSSRSRTGANSYPQWPWNSGACLICTLSNWLRGSQWHWKMGMW